MNIAMNANLIIVVLTVIIVSIIAVIGVGKMPANDCCEVAAG